MPCDKEAAIATLGANLKNVGNSVARIGDDIDKCNSDRDRLQTRIDKKLDVLSATVVDLRLSVQKISSKVVAMGAIVSVAAVGSPYLGGFVRILKGLI